MNDEKKNLESKLRHAELDIEFPDTILVKLSDGNKWHISPMPLSKNRSPLIKIADDVAFICPYQDVKAARKFVIEYLAATTYPKFKDIHFEELLINNRQVQNIWFAAVWGTEPGEVPEMIKIIMQQGMINRTGGASLQSGE